MVRRPWSGAGLEWVLSSRHNDVKSVTGSELRRNSTIIQASIFTLCPDRSIRSETYPVSTSAGSKRLCTRSAGPAETTSLQTLVFGWGSYLLGSETRCHVSQPHALAARAEWPRARQDALDHLVLLSYTHRQLDRAVLFGVKEITATGGSLALPVRSRSSLDGTGYLLYVSMCCFVPLPTNCIPVELAGTR
jgi:hypothetical protein